MVSLEHQVEGRQRRLASEETQTSCSLQTHILPLTHHQIPSIKTSISLKAFIQTTTTTKSVYNDL